MKRIVLLTAIALSVTACGRQSPVDDQVKSSITMALPTAIETDLNAVAKTRAVNEDGSQITTPLHETAFQAAHHSEYCDKASAVKRDINSKGWVYERDDDGPADSIRVFFRRKGTTLIVDYDSDITIACIVGKSYDI